MVFCVCTMAIRIALGILNAQMLIMSLTLFSGGVLMVNQSEQIMNSMLDFDKGVGKEKPSLSALPASTVGWWMVGASTVLFALASFGLGAAYRPKDNVMLTFAIIMTIIAPICIALGALFLNKNSSVHTSLRAKATDQLEKKYGKDGHATFTKSIDGLHYFVKCCGIQGPDDFGDDIPASCCKGFNLTVFESCGFYTNSTLSEELNLQKGCYNKFLDVVVENKGLMAFYGLLVTTLVTEAGLGYAYLIMQRLTPGSTNPKKR